MRMKHITSAGIALSLAIGLLGCDSSHGTAPIAQSELSASGDMTPNADGTASFEFRVANERADIIVTGFTVTATFHNGAVSAENAFAEYHWSFRSAVLPKSQLLEYGVLDAKKVAALKKRHAEATGGADADPLAKALYTYRAKIDSQVIVGGK
jgi:hypothetical protein